MTHKTPEIIIQPPFCETRLVKQISSQTIIKVKLLSSSPLCLIALWEFLAFFKNLFVPHQTPSLSPPRLVKHFKHPSDI